MKRFHVWGQDRERRASKLQSLTQATGQEAPDMSELSEHVGDTHAALFVSSRTGLIRGAVIGVSLEVGGRDIELYVTYRLKSVNRPVPGL